MAELSAARAKGHNGGRPSKLSPDQVRAARRLYDEREHTVQQIGSIFAVSRTSIYRALRDKPGRRLAPAGGHGAGVPLVAVEAGVAGLGDVGARHLRR